ncbi:hypothetical protein B0H10DRAFT_1963153 [Mycena sp. CBHHK59/15]|nr:hypothetical protein B0H10DRAFT_1963153 [Mycena sp. CBHHK59/15]
MAIIVPYFYYLDAASTPDDVIAIPLNGLDSSRLYTLGAIIMEHAGHPRLRLPSSESRSSGSSDTFGSLEASIGSPFLPHSRSQFGSLEVGSSRISLSPSQSVHSNGRQAYIPSLEHLHEEVLVLRAENAVLKSNFQALVQCLQTNSSNSVVQPAAAMLPSLEQSDYPDTKLWQKSSWTARIAKDTGRSKTNKATRNSLMFIEDKHGNPPSEDRIAEFTAEGIAPYTWGQASLSAQDQFRAKTEADIPELRLCDGHWKADKLASIVFASWCVKQEPEGDGALQPDDDINDDPEEITERSAKRKSATDNSAGRPSKRPKLLTQASTTAHSKAGKKERNVRLQRLKNPLLGKTPEARSSVSAPSASTVPSHDDGPDIVPMPQLPLHTSGCKRKLWHELTFHLRAFCYFIIEVPCLLLLSLPLSVGLSCSLGGISHARLSRSPAGLSRAVSPALPLVSPGLSPVSPVSCWSLPISRWSLPVSAGLSHSPAGLSQSLAGLSRSRLKSKLVPTVSMVHSGVPVVSIPPPKKRKKWTPSTTSTTARGLCALRWKQNNPAGDGDEYDTFWKALSDEEKKPWVERAAAAKAAMSQYCLSAQHSFIGSERVGLKSGVGEWGIANRSRKIEQQWGTGGGGPRDTRRYPRGGFLTGLQRMARVTQGLHFGNFQVGVGTSHLNASKPKSQSQTPSRLYDFLLQWD